MSYFFEDVLVPFFVVFLIGSAFFAFIGGIAYTGTSYECQRYSEITGRDTKMGAGACYVKENGEWYRWDEYKMRFATKGDK